MKYLLAILTFIFTLTLAAQEKQGDSLMALGNYDKALKAYRLLPEMADKHFKMARAATAMGNIPMAVDFYIKGFKKDSTSIRPRWEYGKLVLAQNDIPQAFQVFSVLTQEDPENATYHYYLGEVYSRTKQDDTAVSAFAKALQLNPNYRAARIELIKSYIAKRETGKAIHLCEEYLADFPDDIKINSLYAQALINSNFYDQAVVAFEHLFELGSDTEYNRKTLGFAYYSISEYQKSLEQYEMFQQDYDAKDPVVNFMMSKCYLGLRQLDNAQDFIERAIVFKTPRLDQEFLQLASVYANKEDLKNTLYALKRASKENPASDDIAYQVVIGADRYFKDKEEKLKYYEKFIEDYPKSDYHDMAAARARDLKKELFMDGGE
jgi:tetratricopeptide (TPR) repeat protein